MIQAKTLGELKQSGYRGRSVKDELRANLIEKLRAGERIFPGIVGYDETVVPQITNAILSRHNLILLGLRGQAKSRIIRQLTDLLDERIPTIAGSEINDDPFHPISAYGRQTLELHGDMTHIEWVERDSRFVEKLATPDVTIADIIGDVDPIKAAKGGHLLSDELTIHYGLLPRANRGIFEQIAFEARDDQRIDKRSGVSQRLPITVMESVISNAERRALLTEEEEIVPRISDIYAAVPSITGKMELEYEGEQIGAG